MAHLTLPIPSPVPLHILTMSIEGLVGRTEGRSSSVKTRLRNRCNDYGIDLVWMLALTSRRRFLVLKNSGRKTADLADELLGAIDCSFDMFPVLHEALESVRARASMSASRYVDFFTVLMTLASIRPQAKDGEVVAYLAEYGLRPGMPLDELFVHDPSLASPPEPRERTVVEELLAFLLLPASEAFPSEVILGGLTVAELAVQLAVSPEPNLHDRGLLISAMRDRLSPRALKKLGIEA